MEGAAAGKTRRNAERDGMQKSMKWAGSSQMAAQAMQAASVTAGEGHRGGGVVASRGIKRSVGRAGTERVRPKHLMDQLRQ